MENHIENGYYYINNVVEGEKNKIHKASCSECKSGIGKNWFKKRVHKDLWLGPFKTKEQASQKISYLFNKKAEFHDCCEKD